MRRLMLAAAASLVLAGCHTVPVSGTYDSGYYYDRGYDYSVPLALTAGVALGYLLFDGRHHSHKAVPYYYRPNSHHGGYRGYKPIGRGYHHR